MRYAYHFINILCVVATRRLSGEIKRSARPTVGLLIEGVYDSWRTSPPEPGGSWVGQKTSGVDLIGKFGNRRSSTVGKPRFLSQQKGLVFIKHAQ